MLRLAITGTEGAGKSVFLTTFAKHLQNGNQGWGLDPLSVQTQQYVETHWDLLRHGEWPPATQPGTFAELHWTLTLPPDLEGVRQTASFSVVDPAGHDFRNLYTNDYEWNGELPESVFALAATLRCAHILFVLVNLKDFLGEPNAERRLNSELALKFALDAAKSQGVCRNVAILVTQADQYPQLAQGDDWRQTLRNVIPIFAAAHLDMHSEVFPITAVDRVRILTEADGHSRKVPESDFQSQGYEAVLAWLRRIVPSIQDQLKFDRALAGVKHTGSKLFGYLLDNCVTLAWFGLGAILLYLSLKWIDKSREIPQPKFSTPTLSYVKRIDPGVFDQDTYYDYRVTVDITNQGGSGVVTFKLYLDKNIESYFIKESFQRGEVKRIERKWIDYVADDDPKSATPFVELVK